MQDPKKTVLIIIDIQEKLLNAVYNKELIEKNSKVIAKAASILNIPVIITEQYPKGLGKTISAISNNINQDTSYYYEKVDFNAITDKYLLDNLKSMGRNQVILCGIETHICVYQTALALLEEGFDVSLIKDVCSSRQECEHYAGVDLMKQNGVLIKTKEIVLFELLKNSNHANFKEIQKLIL